ncbi:hypothetical protein [Candidatus Rickettsia kedanie]
MNKVITQLSEIKLVGMSSHGMTPRMFFEPCNKAAFAGMTIKLPFLRQY